MSHVFKPHPNFSASAYIQSMAQYQELYRQSIDHSDQFWAKEAERIDWVKRWDRVSFYDFKEGIIRWFEGGKLNVTYNCLDRHVEKGFGDQTAILWEGNEPGEQRKVTYMELLEDVCRLANALQSLGVKKGDRVCIYLQMIPELPVAMLACARIGAIHSVVFGAFSAESLKDRIQDATCSLLITQDWGVRGAKKDIPMKKNADAAVHHCPSIEHVIVVRRTGQSIAWDPSRDILWDDIVNSASDHCPCVPMDAEDPLFILYTSGSTGKPKGVLHTTGGYLVFVSMSHAYIFDYHPSNDPKKGPKKENDVYWCTADIGWVTGHSYIVYGPLANRATVVMFEGIPNYPDFGRFWAICEKYRVKQFYTAPTALRALMKEGDAWVTPHDRSSLKLLGTVGEPIKDPEWRWYYRVVGEERCPIVDTWWQTETGGILITPLPGATPLKPGSATFPFFGVQPVILDEHGKELMTNPARGYLCIKASWPGMMRTVYGDHRRFVETYFKRFPGYYLTGDGAVRDEDGYYWIIGRIDDVLNVSGHRLGTAELEGAIGQHPKVAEAAVVGYPHEIKGDGIYAYVTLKTGHTGDDGLRKAISEEVNKHIGPHAKPDKIQFTSALPKTRSGKIMRRILRKIAEGRPEDVGDISTLADPSVVEALVKDRI